MKMKIICKQCHTRFDEKERYCPYCYEKAVRSKPVGETNSVTHARTYSRSDMKQFDKTKINRKIVAPKKNPLIVNIVAIIGIVVFTILMSIVFLLIFNFR